jgi:hypothetical protein
MTTYKPTKRFVTLAMVLALLVSLIVTAWGDTGPKPSVHVAFDNMDDVLCYGTLLSERKSTGPASAWDGDPDHAQHNGMEGYGFMALDEATWQKFVDYADADGYYFLQEGWLVNDSEGLAWTYYPPNPFKILLYFPDTGEFLSSEVMERYAFHSYFDAVVNTDSLSALKDQASADAADAEMKVQRNYRYVQEFLALAVRILITLAVELVLAVLFGLRKKQQFRTIAVVNVVTQVLLNVALFFINYHSGYRVFVIYYVILELAVFGLEAILFCRLLRRNNEKPAIPRIVLYALCANAASFFVGIWLADRLPYLF